VFEIILAYGYPAVAFLVCGAGNLDKGLIYRSLLYSPMVEKATPLGEELLAVRQHFLSQIVLQTCNGYAMSQFKKIEQDIRNLAEVRWKHAMLYCGCCSGLPLCLRRYPNNADEYAGTFRPRGVNQFGLLFTNRYYFRWILSQCRHRSAVGMWNALLFRAFWEVELVRCN
jgi:hypothetical protein